MPQILIFQTPDREDAPGAMSGTTDEKSIIYENLIVEFKNTIDDYHFKRFLDMENQVLKTEKKVARGIPPIIAKELIKYIKPLIVELPYGSLKKELPSKFRKKTEDVKINIDKWHIALQDESPVHGILYPITAGHAKKYEKIRLKNIIVPQNTSFKIVGFALHNDLGIPVLDTSIFVNSFVDDIAISNYDILVKTGSYGLHSVSNTKNSKKRLFTQQFDTFEHTKTNYQPQLNIEFLNKTKTQNNRLRAVIFKSDSDALMKMNIILDELNRIQSYYIKNYFSVFRTIRFNPLKKLGQFQRKKKPDDEKLHVNEKLMSIIGDILPDETMSNTKDSIYFALKNKGFLDLFNKLKIAGFNDPKIQQEYNKAKIKSEIDRILGYQNRIRTSYLLKLLKKQAVTVDKFGKDIKYMNLKQKDRKVVDNEYNKIIEEEKANLEDQSPGASSSKKREEIRQRNNIIKNFYMAFNSVKKQRSLKEALRDLKTIGINTEKSTLKYGLCEHNLLKAKLIIAGERDKKIKETIIEKYAHSEHKKADYNMNLDISDDYYCNICGERVYINIVEDTIKFVGGQLVIASQEYDALGDLIYKEVSYVVRAVIRFKTEMDVRPIVKSLASVLRPEIGIIETRLMKIRTNIGDDIRDLITLYINIYTYALLSHMIYINPGEITFAQRPKYKSNFKQNSKSHTVAQKTAIAKRSETKGGYGSSENSSSGYESDIDSEESVNFPVRSKLTDSDSTESFSDTDTPRSLFINKRHGGKVDTKNRLQNIITSAYYLLISTKTNEIKKVVTIKLEDIKPLLIKAYKWVIGLHNVDSNADYVGSTGSKGDIVDNIINSPVYKYLYHVRHMLHGTEKEDISTILGRSVATIEKNILDKDVFDNVPQITEDQFIGYIKKKLSGPNESNTEDYVKLISKIMYKSYKKLVSYISTSQYKESSVPLSNILVDYYKEWDEILDMQKSVIYMNMLEKAMPIYIPNHYKFKDRFEYDASVRKLDISKLYRKNGDLHNWDTYVFKKKQGSGTKELNIKELNSLLRNGRNFHKDYRLSDRKDSVTKEYLSKIRDYSSEIIKNMAKSELLENLFEYFKVRCPESGLHITLDTSGINNKCAKCGIVLTPEWRKTNEADRYYKKYHAVFEKQTKEQNILSRKGLEELKEEKEKIIESDIYRNVEKIDAASGKKLFQLNEAKVLDWSRKAKVSFNILANLGLSERFKFDKIEKGEINPLRHEDVTIDDIGNRTLKLDGYYNNIIYQYYLIKGHMSSYDLPHELNELIDKLPSSKGLQASMKEIYDPEYHTRFVYFLHINKKPDDINKFILNKITNTLLDIITSTEKTKFSKFGQELFKFFTDEIINREKLFSKPDPFKYKIDKRAELGNDYASDSSNLDSSSADFGSTDEYRSSTQISSTDTDVLEKESDPIDTLENFAFEESDIVERNDGGE